MLSIIILSKDEAQTIRKCIESVRDIADELIVVDSDSLDNTCEIAKSLGGRVYINKLVDFSTQRNFAMGLSKGDWILYLDADEQATEEFKKELMSVIENYREDSRIGGYFINRRNFFLGKDWDFVDKVQRLFYKKFFVGWEGVVHETPRIKGRFDHIQSAIFHHTHRNLQQMLEKTNRWSEFEADLRIKAHHPRMNIFRFIRVLVTGFLKSYFKEKGYKNGTEGIIEAIYQAFSMFVTYSKLWEKQKKFSKS